jgi:DNA polymerase I-like protein with 3'-5' exonuclease and polymerase domains
VITLDGVLGGRPITVLAPETDEDLADFRQTFPAGGLYGLDVESTYLTDLAQFDPDFRVRTVQFATEDVAWVLRLRIPAQLTSARELLLDETVSFSSHSNMDVLSVAARLGADITGRNVDTLMLARMADPDKDDDRDLKTLTTRYLGPELAGADEELYARFKELWPGRKNAKRSDIEAHGWSTIPDDDPVYLLYAGLDAIADRRLVPLLTVATQAPAELIRVEQFLATRANRIQLRGMRVDLEALEALRDESVTAVEQAKARFAEITGGVNAQYAQGVVGWFAEHGVNWVNWAGARTETGAPSLAKENLKLVELDFVLDEVGRTAYDQLVLVKAHLDLKNKTVGLCSRVDPSGRVHPVLHPMGASTTARMSSTGPNFQNFSKKDPRMRGLFLPEPGHVLVTIDFEQVELRVVAALAREEKMIDTILAGGDLHQLTVDELAAAGVTITRDTAKIVNFLIVYGGSGKALHEQTGIPLTEAQGIVTTWRERYPAITALAKYLGLETQAIRTVSGRRLPVTVNRKNGDLRTYASINYLVQSSARELLVDAWLSFDAAGYGACVWYPIHDELVLQVPEGQVEEVTAAAERAMRFEFRGVPISATAVELRDREGVSRWMTSKLAEKIALERAA